MLMKASPLFPCQHHRGHSAGDWSFYIEPRPLDETAVCLYLNPRPLGLRSWMVRFENVQTPDPHAKRRGGYLRGRVYPQPNHPGTAQSIIDPRKTQIMKARPYAAFQDSTCRTATR